MAETIDITQAEAKQKVKDIRGGKFFTVVFVKRTDGSERTMNCRKGVKKGLKGGTLRFDPVAKDLVSVFDIPKGQYRFISLDEIKSVSANGKKYIVK